MSLTFEFISLLIFIVVPGLLYQRFYFLGEFSKQFNTKGSVYRAIFFSIIPGIIIQFLAFSLYAFVHCKEEYFENTINLSFEIFKSTNGYSEEAISFITNGYYRFIIHQFFVFILAICLGFLSYIVVRGFKLDIIIKILRFKNQWFYIFNGELNDFKKFKKFNATVINKQETKHAHYLTQVDVLVGEGNTLFTGFLVDYDLSYENINDLDKIYLKNVHRYRETNDGDKEKGLEIFGSRTKVPIKGDVFILDANKILNMNILYVPQIIKTKKPKKNSIKSSWYLFCSIIYIVLLMFFIYSWFNPNNFDSFFKINIQINWFHRLLITFTSIQLVSIFSPSIQKENDIEIFYYDLKQTFEAFRIFLFFLFITFFSIYYSNIWIFVKNFF